MSVEYSLSEYLYMNEFEMIGHMQVWFWLMILSETIRTFVHLESMNEIKKIISSQWPIILMNGWRCAMQIMTVNEKCARYVFCEEIHLFLLLLLQSMKPLLSFPLTAYGSRHFWHYH